MMGKIVKIEVSSRIPEFRDFHLTDGIADVGATWDAFLRAHGITLNPEKHILANKTGNKIAFSNEKIGEFVRAYKRSMSIYSVRILNTAHGKTKKKIAEKKLRIKKERLERAESGGNGRRRSAASIRRMASRTNGHITLGPQKTVRFQAPTPRQYPEDDPSFPLGQQQNDVENPPDDVTFNDDASVFSQDSQDMGDDIKSEIIRKLLNGASNGDMHRVRAELQLLRQQQKSMKVARYVPHTMNLLNLMFSD